MKGSSVVPLGAEHMSRAAALLAARQQRWRRAVPSLPKRYEDAREAQRLLEATLGAADAYALAAVDDTGMLLAYMVGTSKLEEIWGRSAWVALEGQAAGDDTDPELTRDLYAAWGDHWVTRGIFAHYALVPAAFQEAVDAWFSTGFGKMHAHALRSTDVSDLGTDLTALAIHRARPGDHDAVTALGELISRALLEAPTFAVTLPERWETMRAEWEHELEEPEGDLWVAGTRKAACPWDWPASTPQRLDRRLRKVRSNSGWP